MDEPNTTSVSGPADDPAVVAQALNLLGNASNAHDRNFEALAALLGVIIGRGAPKGSDLHAAALVAIAVVRSRFPDAGALGVFEACMQLASAPSPTDGGGLPANEALPCGPLDLPRKTA